MSNSELSDAPVRKLPSAGAMEAALRKEVVKQFEDPEKTVNTIREGAERSLGLETGFFKEHKTWKGKSKGFIHDEIVSGIQSCAQRHHSNYARNYNPTFPNQARVPSPRILARQSPRLPNQQSKMP
jgi:hypothetical protein